MAVPCWQSMVKWLSWHFSVIKSPIPPGGVFEPGAERGRWERERAKCLLRRRIHRSFTWSGQECLRNPGDALNQIAILDIQMAWHDGSKSKTTPHIIWFSKGPLPVSREVTSTIESLPMRWSGWTAPIPFWDGLRLPDIPAMSSNTEVRHKSWWIGGCLVRAHNTPSVHLMIKGIKGAWTYWS